MVFKIGRIIKNGDFQYETYFVSSALENNRLSQPTGTYLKNIFFQVQTLPHFILIKKLTR